MRMNADLHGFFVWIRLGRETSLIFWGQAKWLGRGAELSAFILPL
jgi:hypothetical protein